MHVKHSSRLFIKLFIISINIIGFSELTFDIWTSLLFPCSDAQIEKIQYLLLQKVEHNIYLYIVFIV